MCKKCGKGYACMCMGGISPYSGVLERTDLYELGRKVPYYKHIEFPANIAEQIFGEEIPFKDKNPCGEIPLSKIEYTFPTDENYTESVMHYGTPKVWQVPEKCICDIVLLMREGCKCGGK